jgi:hypothetical protein
MPTSQAESSPESLSPAIRELLSIFEGELAKVQFPSTASACDQASPSCRWQLRRRRAAQADGERGQPGRARRDCRPIRLASKSIRCREVLRRVMASRARSNF